MASEKFTVDQMIAAIKANSGMITHVADSLGCSYNTVRNYMAKHPTVKQAMDDAKTRMADRIETTLYTIAVGKPTKDGKAWEQEPNVTALIFLAKTHPAMRERGYAERTELANAPGETFQLTWVEAVKQARKSSGESE
jgi:hypothetical protein